MEETYIDQYPEVQYLKPIFTSSIHVIENAKNGVFGPSPLDSEDEAEEEIRHPTMIPDRIMTYLSMPRKKSDSKDKKSGCCSCWGKLFCKKRVSPE